jgi:hypothetical protein
MDVIVAAVVEVGAWFKKSSKKVDVNTACSGDLRWQRVKESPASIFSGRTTRAYRRDQPKWLSTNDQ